MIQDPASNGALLLDKPSGITSHDVVDVVRRVVGQRRVGHTGTLDPLATGLCIVLVGHATRFSNYITSARKGYEVLFRLGLSTQSWDIASSVVEDRVNIIDTSTLIQTMDRMKGSLELRVPPFSAVKVNGQKLYQLARAGRETPHIFRTMTFHEVTLLEYSGDFVRCRLLCDAGGYVRSWVHRLGQDLGVGATVVELRRFLCEPYSIDDAVTLDKVNPNPWLNGKAWIPMNDLLLDWPQIVVNGRWETLVRGGQIPHGCRASISDLIQSKMSVGCVNIGVRIFGAGGHLVGLALPSWPGGNSVMEPRLAWVTTQA